MEGGGGGGGGGGGDEGARGGCENLRPPCVPRKVCAPLGPCSPHAARRGSPTRRFHLIQSGFLSNHRFLSFPVPDLLPVSSSVNEAETLIAADDHPAPETHAHSPPNKFVGRSFTAISSS